MLILTARDALNDAGYQVEEIEPPLLKECALDGYRALMGEAKALMAARGIVVRQ